MRSGIFGGQFASGCGLVIFISFKCIFIIFTFDFLTIYNEIKQKRKDDYLCRQLQNGLMRWKI